MKFRFPVHFFCSAVLLFLFCAVSPAADSKASVRLRNKIITPTDSAVQASASVNAASAIDKPTAGLFLIQFTGPPKSAWREQLKTAGVELIHYVPDNAFVAKFEGARPNQIQKLDFVRWVGSYRPEYKLDSRLLHQSVTNSARSDAIAVLLSPRASETDVVQVKRSLQSVSRESNYKFGRVIRGTAAATQVNALANSDSVLWIEPAPKMKLFDEVSSRIVGGDGPPGQTLAQSLGYDGAGVTVAVADSGLDSGDTNDMHADIAGRVKRLFFYGSVTDAADEHGHGTHCAGIIAGDGALGETDENGFLYGLGVAPGASIIAQRIFDGAGNYTPPASFEFETLTRDAKRAGADIGSNSWGDDTQGRYDISAMEFDALVRDADALTLGDQPYILEFSAGNAGPGYQTVGSPAVAKNVIATGAANSDRRNLPIEEFTIYDTGPDTMADFSSRGPCADGRIKPDITAPGTWIASLRSVYANDSYAWWPISENYFYEGGTSQAGPHVSGAAAVFVQFYRESHGGATPSPALVKAALINSATDMDDFEDTGPVPNMDEGWGRVYLPALVDPTRNYDFLDQSVLLTNDAVYEKRVLIGSADEPLKVTLTYTDVPGNPASVIALVNDLDLEVQSPDGHLYRGNQFSEGESIPDPPGTDTINNVEAVHLLAPVPGEYIIRIRGSRVVEDARQDSPALDQDFALVVSGSFAAPGVGIVTFNRPAYRAPDQIKLVLVDYDLAGQASASILLRSGTEPAGENIALQADGITGLFTGAVATVTGAAVTDGKLQISHGDTIEAVYADALPSANRVFAARADLLPPAISDVQGTNQFGQVVVSWNTDEDTRSYLFYGTNTPPDLGLTNNVLDLSHEFQLPNIPVNSTVNFFVVAEDEAGNRTTNDNGGTYFTVINSRPTSILLIDSYTDSSGLVAAPPLTGYTDALDALGVVYDVFDNTTGDEPTLAQMQSYSCVIWRMDEITAPAATLPQKLATYVNGGGSLFIASMEALTRLTEAGLASLDTSLLQVQSYTEDQPVSEIAGSGDPLGAGINTALDYSPYADLLALLELVGTPDPSDWIVPTTNASPVLLSDGSIVGVRSPKAGVDLPGRVVFLSFPFDAVPLGSGIGNNRIGLLHNVLNFLVPQPGGGTLTLDSDVYSVPGRALVELEDLDIQGKGQANISVSSPEHGDTIDIALAETVRAGLFRGSFFFTPTNAGAPGTLFVQSGDTVQADYVKPSSGQTISATASIDTNAPVISNVTIEPGYLEALVSWDTSKDADALVQFSTSPDKEFRITFVGYDPTLTTHHEVLLNKPTTNMTYYLRVTSRDRAGNSTIDDNGGNLYSFTLLQPRLPPWSDNMETNSPEWSVISANESEAEWTRGVPGGGETAHSPNNCWGINLSGGPVSLAESYLISPGVLLTGGNRATLHFWHNYDLIPQSDLEFSLAAVEIITNVTTSPELLWQLPEDSSFGWEEQSIDLTPYKGNVVYIVWYYFLFSFDAPPRLGWLVDDVSITVDDIVPGTIQVTNNLWQAVFALSGPAGTLGHGSWTVITNTPPGQYVVDFGDVPYYLTPQPQTNTLNAGGLITFQGNYTFADANANGIPDLWELQNFGVVDPLRTWATDTDHDGVSDGAESVAGTDPNNPPPPFRLSAKRIANGFVQLSWPSVTNHTYRVHGSVNAASWSAYSNWLPADGTNTTFTLPTPTNGAPNLFRVEAVPPSGPNALPAVLRLTAKLLPSGVVRLEWPSSPGHGYRVWGSDDATNWSPVSDWIRASSSATSFDLPSATNGAPHLFRLEVAP